MKAVVIFTRQLSFILVFTWLCSTQSGCNEQKGKGNNQQIEYWFSQLTLQRNRNLDSMQFYSKLLDSASVHQNNEALAMAAIGRALVQSNLANYQTALREYSHAEKLLANSTADNLKGRVAGGQGTAHTNLGNYVTAMEKLLAALRIFEKSGYTEGVSGVYSQISQVYQLKGELSTSKLYVLKGLQAMENNKLSNPYLVNLHTLANIYGMGGQLDSALYIDAIGMKLCDDFKSSFLKSMFYDNKANCFVELNKFDSAAYFYKRCLEIDSAHGNVKQVSDTYLNLGGMYFKKGELNTAIAHVQRSIVLATQTGYLFGKQGAYDMLSQIYKAQNNPLKALEANDSTAAIKNKIINSKSETKIAELTALYESEKREQTILLQQAKIDQQKILIIGIVASALALVAAIYFNYRRNALKREKQVQEQLHLQQQQATQQILEAEEHERKRIATDLHDGVGQTMMAAWLNLQAYQQQYASNETNQQMLYKVIQLVDESCKEVRAVSHSMMPTQLANKGFVEAIRVFTNQFDNSLISINLHSSEAEINLDEHTQTVLYRVIQECVNNVIKHSGAQKLDISIHQESDGLDVLIEDNGKGFDLEKAIKKEGIGLQNIRGRIHYLHGTVDWDTNSGNGTVVSIHIPSKI